MGRFEGWYYKHQKGKQVLALIPGRGEDSAFIQVVTNRQSVHIPYPLDEYEGDTCLRVGASFFSSHGIHLDIHAQDITLTGDLRYQDLTPIAYDIMGPFRFLPMECRHSVLSMAHRVTGCLRMNGTPLNLSGGTGYLEGDSGASFPLWYTWVQCNEFQNAPNCALMLAIAKIPVGPLHFPGCIGIVHLNGREYRLATYQGVQLQHRTSRRLQVRQGKYQLTVTIPKAPAHPLQAPDRGAMRRVIHESPACRIHVRFTEGDRVLLDSVGQNAGFESVPAPSSARAHH